MEWRGLYSSFQWGFALQLEQLSVAESKNSEMSICTCLIILAGLLRPQSVIYVYIILFLLNMGTVEANHI